MTKKVCHGLKTAAMTISANFLVYVGHDFVTITEKAACGRQDRVKAFTGVFVERLFNGKRSDLLLGHSLPHPALACNCRPRAFITLSTVANSGCPSEERAL